MKSVFIIETQEFNIDEGGATRGIYAVCEDKDTAFSFANDYIDKLKYYTEECIVEHDGDPIDDVKYHIRTVDELFSGKFVKIISAKDPYDGIIQTYIRIREHRILENHKD